MAKMKKADELAARTYAKGEQRRSVQEAERRGTRGRAEHKGGAPTSNKGRGGKSAR